MDSAPTDPDISQPLARWLVDDLEGVDAATVGAFDRPSGGYSAETLIVPVTFNRGGTASDEHVVLRREMPEPPIYPVQVPVENEIDIQWRVMSALSEHADVPIAPLLGYETDASVLGSPFFVMGFIPGEIPREDPMYAVEGFYVDAAAEERTRMIETGIDVMAGVHAVNVGAAGLEWLSPPGTVNDGHRQLQIWRDYAAAGLDGRPHDLMLRAFERVAEELPTGGESVLNWGDARLGNVIWQDFRPGCLTDFEASALAPRRDGRRLVAHVRTVVACFGWTRPVSGSAVSGSATRSVPAGQRPRNR